MAGLPDRPPAGELVEVRRSGDRRRFAHWRLCLVAVAIAHVEAHERGERALLVRAEDAERAAAELDAYDRENRAWPPPRELPSLRSTGAAGATAWCAVLFAFYAADRLRFLGLDWRAAGRGDSERFRAGEWWRAVTSLFLHVDLVHLLSNLLFGALFVALVCQLLGSAPGLLLVLLSGALGDALDSLLRASAHRTVGASTAVFGALGVLIGFRWSRRRSMRLSWVVRWTPIFGGLLYLAMFSGAHGVLFEGRPVNIVAHLTGFASGIGLGALGARLEGRLAAWRASDAALAAATLAAIAGAWALALR